YDPSEGGEPPRGEPDEQAQWTDNGEPQADLAGDLTDALQQVAPTQRPVAAAPDHPVGEHLVAAQTEDRQPREPPVVRELRYTEQRGDQIGPERPYDGG